ncbi:MAG: IS200/IS605 family element transposase accessory protein TnpB [Tatlockia sp.]|nr:IS200/IS605 family element transposase accessory protein TnpB [Tatlockia sp.]
MKARYQYRIYPTDQQRTELARVFGCCRVVYNDALAMCKQSDKLPSNGGLQKVCITQAKKTEARGWLSEVSNIPLQQSISDLGVAYKNYFESLKGKRKGAKVKPPKFKKKDNRQTARFRKGGFSIKNGIVYLAKIGNLRTVWSRPLPAEPSSVTAIKDRAGRYFLSFVVEVESIILPALNPTVGIDLGLKTFAYLSSGELVNSPDYFPLERKIRKAQRKLSRRKKGSARRELMRLKVAKFKAKQADKRKDFLHKLSTKVVSENQTTVLEDLNVSGMLKNRCLSRAISQAGWREFRTMCESKSNKFGHEFVVISRWEPTSQICSDCGYRWGKLDLSVREVVCINCNCHHDRDGNAAKNIEKVGVGHIHDSKRTGRECKTEISAVPAELSTHQEYRQLTLFDCLGITVASAR